MRIEKIICDICGKEARGTEPMLVPTGATYPPTGRTEEVTERVDLCPRCLRDELQSTLQRLPGDDFQRWIATVLARREKWKAEYGS